MGVGRDLGQQLRRWLEQDPAALRQSRALTNRLMDGLGAEESLRAPVRELASQPLLLTLLHSQGVQQQSALSSLRQQLSRTYAPAIERELLDLLEAATGLGGGAPATAAAPAPATTAAAPEPKGSGWRALAPGLALPPAAPWCSAGPGARSIGNCWRAGAGAAAWPWWCCSGCCRP